MKAYLISDNHDSLVGMRLAGMHGCLVHTQKEAEAAIRRAAEMKDTAILVVTEKAAALAPELIRQLRESNSLPLVVEIPDRFGTSKGSGYLTQYVQNAIGVKM